MLVAFFHSDKIFFSASSAFLLVRMVASVHNAAQFFLCFLIWGLLYFQFADVLVDLKSLNLVVGSPLCRIEVESLIWRSSHEDVFLVMEIRSHGIAWTQPLPFVALVFTSGRLATSSSKPTSIQLWVQLWNLVSHLHTGSFLLCACSLMDMPQGCSDYQMHTRLWASYCFGLSLQIIVT
jgi:hypothetical protein